MPAGNKIRVKHDKIHCLDVPGGTCDSHTQLIMYNLLRPEDFVNSLKSYELRSPDFFPEYGPIKSLNP